MLTLKKCAASHITTDFWLYGGEVVLATIGVQTRKRSDYPKCRVDQAVRLETQLPVNPSAGYAVRYDTGCQTTWAEGRMLSLTAFCTWLVSLGVDPGPILELAGEKGWEDEIVAAAQQAVAQARLSLPTTWGQPLADYEADYLVLFTQGGVIGDHAYLPFNEALLAVQSHCDADLPLRPEPGAIIALSDESGDRDAWAYPLYPTPKPRKPQLPAVCPACGGADLQFDGYQVLRVIEDRSDGERWNYETPDKPTGQWTEMAGHCLGCEHEWDIVPARATESTPAAAAAGVTINVVGVYTHQALMNNDIPEHTFVSAGFGPTLKAALRDALEREVQNGDYRIADLAVLAVFGKSGQQMQIARTAIGEILLELEVEAEEAEAEADVDLGLLNQYLVSLLEAADTGPQEVNA